VSGWLAGAALALGALYLTGLLVSRPPASLRLVPLLACFVIAAGWTLPFRILIGVALAAAACGALGAYRAWLIRSEPDALRRALAEGLRRLLVDAAQPEKDTFVLALKRGSVMLRVRRVGPACSLLVLSGALDQPKARLLTQWIPKQFPGPGPRVRVSLPRRSP
jgi:hypothetical protein